MKHLTSQFFPSKSVIDDHGQWSRAEGNLRFEIAPQLPVGSQFVSAVVHEEESGEVRRLLPPNVRLVWQGALDLHEAIAGDIEVWSDPIHRDGRRMFDGELRLQSTFGDSGDRSYSCAVSFSERLRVDCSRLLALLNLFLSGSFHAFRVRLIPPPVVIPALHVRMFASPSLKERLVNVALTPWIGGSPLAHVFSSLRSFFWGAHITLPPINHYSTAVK